MSVIQGLCTSFKKELLEGGHDFLTDTIKVALYTSNADIGPHTTSYSATNEITGVGYTAGGATMTAVAPTTSGMTALVDFNDVTWSTASLTARGALIYNSTQSNKAVMVLDFGIDRVKTAADFVLTMPTADKDDALIRLA